MFDLKVTTACSVVLLPSNQPFGRIPGEPQLISDSNHYRNDEDDGSRIIPIIDMIRSTNLYKWAKHNQKVMRLTSTNGLKPGPDFISLAPPHRLPNDHVAVVALVAEHHH